MAVTQIILVVAIAILTTILALVGVEVFLIFREARQAAKKLNKILDNAVGVSESVSRQITNLADLLASAKTMLELFRSFFKKEEEKKQPEKLSLPEEPRNGESAEESSSLGSSVRRFFTRAGKRLS